ncbi:MAG TPA: hypothetical protein VHE30_17135 [Polyangiaceae bacterium]|nr:hypothetical protein [Polyangiaceae bacterium]
MLGLALVASAPSAAFAKDCATNADCTAGFTCQAKSETHCAACSGPSCSPSGANCTTTQIHECYPAPCTSSSDCPGGMICYTAEEKSCNSTGDGTSQCVVTSSERLCVPPWAVPCSGSSCGPTFTCENERLCSVSSNGAESCVPSTEGGTCRAPKIPCGGGSICPSGWTCDSVTTPGEKDCPLTPAFGDGGLSRGCTETPTTTETICVPPYFDEIASLPHSNASDVFTGSSGPGAPVLGGRGSSASGSGDSGGCAVALGSQSNGAALTLLLAVGGLVFGRRRRT